MPPLLNRHRLRLLAEVVALILIQGIAAAVAAFATRDLFSALHENTGLPTISIVSLAMSGVFIGATRVLSRVRGELVGQSYALELRRALFDQEAAMAQHDVAVRRVGYTSLRFVGDLTAIRNWPSLGLPRLAAALILLPATLVVLGALNPRFLVFVTPVLAIGIIVITVGGLHLPARFGRLRNQRARIAADMAERMPIAPLLSALGRRDSEKRRINKTSEKMIDAAVARLRLSESLKAMPDLLAGVLCLLVIWSGMQSQTSTATIAAGLAAVGIALKPIRDLATVWSHLSAFRIARAKCAKSLSRPKRNTTEGTARLRRGPVSVCIKELSAGPIDHLSKDIRAGSIMNLEGPTGSGKTLLLNLLAGFDAPDAGSLKLSGQPIQGFKPSSLRRSVALISAHPPILKGSLRRALTFGASKRPDDQKILEIASRFGLNALISGRGGLDAKIAEGGRDLSDGQRVRIALVRAALNSPGLVLVDSVSELLDVACRATFRESLKRSGATVLAVDSAQLLGFDYSDRLTLT